MTQEIEILETQEIQFENPVFILGFPDVGLVGTIAAYHIIDKLKLKETAHLESDQLPPVVVVHDAKASSPIRIYANQSVGVVVSEVPITMKLIPPLSKKLAKWFKEKNASLVIPLGGVPHPKRLEAEELNTYGLFSLPEDKHNWRGKIKNSGVKSFHEGILVGLPGIMVRECEKQKINSVYLMTESHYHYPDPEASAEMIKLLNKILDLEIDVKELMERGEEIKIKARDLMKRTQEEMKQMQKSQEQEMPVMYR